MHTLARENTFYEIKLLAKNENVIVVQYSTVLTVVLQASKKFLHNTYLKKYKLQTNHSDSIEVKL